MRNISVVVSVDAYHNDYVYNEVEDLQDHGYEVERIVRISKMFLGIFGNDVTHIHYKTK